MRGLVLILVAATIAGPAAAQAGGMPMPPPQAAMPSGDLAPPLPTARQRYVMKLSNLRDRTLRIKAKDGGQLRPDHAANLQHDLDALNHQFGVTSG
jgi:hypothetical protein